ncbi:hypothetical protein HOH87_04920 [bacterium]|jgi:16S rRNA (guanine(527)-N(7))-methyltransferase RsmG|nr:hypothetical protein [bacterium]
MSTQKIKDYIALLKDYNDSVNIYSKNAYPHLDFHIEDSQNMAELIGNTSITIADMGSGSGLPSIILAIMNPNNKIWAIESKGKKRTFLKQAKETLDLENYNVFDGDTQEYANRKIDKIDVLTAKAFAKLPKVIKIAQKMPILKESYLLVPITQKQVLEYDLKSTDLITKVTKSNNFIYFKQNI